MAILLKNLSPAQLPTKEEAKIMFQLLWSQFMGVMLIETFNLSPDY